MDRDQREALILMGTLGFDLDDFRVLFPTANRITDGEIEKCLKQGKVLHRLNASAKLYAIIESPKTTPHDLIAAERHLRDVHTKASAQTGAQELLGLLRGTVPAIPPPDYSMEEDDENEDEN